MIEAEKVVLLLLAAGRSTRFGSDKLCEDFLGRPLACHIVTALEGVPFLDRIAIISDTEFDFAADGYRVIVNDDPDTRLSQSVKLGVKAARDCGAEAVLIALADMPRVTATHIFRLLDAADAEDAVVASSNGEHPTPPVIFAAGQFDYLLTLDGDDGAIDLVRGGRHVIATADELVDIDTPEELARLREEFAPQRVRERVPETLIPSPG